MTRPMTFNCQKCDAAMEVADLQNQDTVRCRSCSRRYRIEHRQASGEWVLVPIEPVGEPEGKPEEPFDVLGEIAAPAKDDLDRDL